MRRNEFKTYHPVVNLLYFVFVIGFSMVFMHPVCLGISFLAGYVYLPVLKGPRKAVSSLLYVLPVFLIMAAINPAFNHEGVTILSYLPSGNPLTMESILYGLCSAAMIVCVIVHFSCWNEIMTSDKIVYLFGKAVPSLSLVFSMTLRLVPRFTAQLKQISSSLKCIGKDAGSGNVVKRTKNALGTLSILVTWALENAVDTADSMKSRGYGLKGRTSFSVFRFDKRDLKAVLCIAFLGVYILIGGISGAVYFRYFPSVKAAQITPYSVSVFVCYLALCLLPSIIEIQEVVKWNYIKSKM